MRLTLRLVSFIFLVVAVLAGAVDSIQSVSASQVVVTDTATAWTMASPSTLEGSRYLVERYIHPSIWDQGVVWVLAQPAFAVLLVLSLIFWMIGYKRPPIAGRFSA